MIGFLAPKSIISKSEKSRLLLWIKNNQDKFLFNVEGPYRKRFRFDCENVEISNTLENIKKRIIKKENINGWIKEPLLGDYISQITNGGYIQRHTDPTILGFSHVRYNLFLSLPVVGGRPIYDDKIIDISENEYLKCESSSYFHGCENVYGEKPRIVISYGFLIVDQRGDAGAAIF